MRAYLRLWRELLTRCWRHSRLLTTAVYVCLAAHTVAFLAIGLALRAAIDASMSADTTTTLVSVVIAALAYATDWALGEIAFVIRMHLVERVALESIDTEILRAAVGIEGVEHLERVEYLDRITTVRGEAWAIVDSAWAALESVALVARLALLVGVLGSVHPWLAGLLVFAAIPLWLGGRGQGRVQRAELASAEPVRLHWHLFDLCTSPSAGKEIRISGAGPALVRRQSELWERAVVAKFTARGHAALLAALGWTVFTLGFCAAIALVVRAAANGAASAGDVVLAIVVGSQLRAAVESAVQRSVETTGYARLLTPYLWLRDYHAAQRPDRPAAGVGDRLTRGIELSALTFTYPGTEKPAIHDLTVRLPAGSVVALVGEYGSGKSTLVKLLAKFYRAQSGTIRVDGTDLDDIDTAAWRAASAAAFQDFGRYHTTLRQAVGLGDPEHMEDDDRITAALAAADAVALADRLPDGTATELGAEFGGLELSEGQWQKVALARACMRPEPLLFILDEPTASLDAPSEHAIFTHYMARARRVAATTRAITVIVSHRFSTVAGADLILVLEQGRLIEAGDHAALLARDGRYAEMYSIQAKAYAEQSS